MTNREKFIFEKLNEHYEEAKTLGYEIFAIIVQGSQNYNLDIYTDEYKSDNFESEKEIQRVLRQYIIRSLWKISD